MIDRRAVPAVTVTVMVLLVLLGAVVGWRAATAPLPDDEEEPASPAELCEADIEAGDEVRPDIVRVSVYNAGTRPGLAGTTLRQLEDRGFLRGEAGNAPRDYKQVKLVRVLAASPQDPAARLVAAQFGPRTRVDATAEEVGPGVEVILGNDFVGLVEGPSRLVAEGSGSGC